MAEETNPKATDPEPTKAEKLAILTEARERARLKHEDEKRGGALSTSGALADPTGAGERARDAAPDPSSATGRADLARASVAILWGIAHDPDRRRTTRMDQISAARALLALAGYQRAAPASKDEAIPFGSLLGGGASDGKSGGRSGTSSDGA